MIDPTDPPEVQTRKQAAIIESLVDRMERSHSLDSSAYSMFQSAIALQAEVWEKTKDLEQVLHSLGQTNIELKSVYRAQEQSQKNLADILEIMEEGFALFTEDKLQIFNKRFKKLLPDVVQHIRLGMEFEDYIRAVSNSRYLDFDADEDRQNWCHARRGNHKNPFSTFTLALKNNRWFQVSTQQTSYGNIAILQTEITDTVREQRKEKDRLIDDHTRFLQAAFDHMSLGIGTFSAHGKLIISNARFAEYLMLPVWLVKEGIDIRRLIECIRNNRIFDESQQPIKFAKWVKTLETEGAVRGAFHRTDGRSLNLHIQRLTDGELIASVMDTTVETQASDALQKIAETLEMRVNERTAALTKTNQLLRQQYRQQAKAEEELRIAKEVAEQANQSKTRFLAAASHDLLQPISAVKLYISTLRDSSSDAKILKIADKLDHSFSTTENLLHALVDISRLGATGTPLTVTEFPISVILDPISESFTPLAHKKELKIDFVASSVWVRSDQHYLQRIVQNLVANAIQYTAGGRILVGIRRMRKSAIIEVWDTGVGISKDDQLVIFQEFKRIKKTACENGMGLGLSIAEQACRQLGHPLHVHSTPGKGSLFRVEVPRIDARTYQFTPKINDCGRPVDLLDLIVMIVEDDPEVLQATTERLESWGASVLAVSSTEGALTEMKALGMPPDLLLVDYQLDGDDSGITTIEHMRKKAGKIIPAIMITADHSYALAASRREKDFSVLTKPVQLSRLRSLIAWETRAGA